MLSYLRDRPKLCVASTLLAYLDCTKELREKERNLFIATRKPYKKVLAQTISRWINLVLGKAEINTEIFSAYSIRHASTSAALAKRVDLEMIKRTAG